MENDYPLTTGQNHGNWWDRLGEPQYGGQINIRASRNIENFDPFFSMERTNIFGGWMERLVSDIWTMDPAVWDYQMPWHPSKYMRGQLAESWDFPEPGTHVIHLRHDVHWQNLPPANGREFIADDVVFHFNRLCGLNGYPNPSPFPLGPQFKSLLSVTAADRYTLVFKWSVNNPEFIMEALHGVSTRQCLENPEAVKQWGDLSDWHHAVGTGPFTLDNFISEDFAKLVKVPDYPVYDERYPQNRLPYVDSIKYVIAPDMEEALEAMRAGVIDIISGSVTYEQAQAMLKSNPEILQFRIATRQAVTLQPRCDLPPFNDIRVRRAMQLAFDLPALAKDYYHGVVEPYPSSVLSSYYSRAMPGWGFPYEQWPQDLKDEYRYDPAAARRLLAEAGYPHGFKTNIIVDTASDMELYKIIKSSLAAVGIELTEQPMEPNDCTSFVEQHKHDGLVYREYGPLGHAYAPFQALTRMYTGTNIMLVSDPVIDAAYDKAVANPGEAVLKQALRDMNERVARQHYAVSLLQPLEFSLCQPWVKGYHGQIHSVWMGIGGPSRLSFYGARFWVDQKLKKSLGH
jgi:peptide/nickel transport system substrate-binding protein